MTPRKAFEDVWARCDQLHHLHAYLSRSVTQAVSLDDLLRSEWALRVSALDLYVHELATQRMVEVFQGLRTPTPAFNRFQITFDTIRRIQAATHSTDAASAFELEVRTQFSYKTFQDPEDIAWAIRHCSTSELWNDVAAHLGAAPSEKVERAKFLKRDLSLIVQRRNKIVHEGDLMPQLPRMPWPIHVNDVALVATRVQEIVSAIDALIA